MTPDTEVGSPALEVRDLRVRFDGDPPVTALDGVDLVVPRGAAVGLIGESGSGKTTLSRVAAGLLSGADPEGRVTVAGRGLTGASETAWREVRWRDVALVPQSTAALTPTLTVGAQLAEPLRVQAYVGRRAARREAERALTRVGLDPELVHARPAQLSGGQRRLAMIAMAMVTDPALIVLDEPTVGLDPATRERVLELLAELRAHGTALLIATHDLTALQGLADRVAVLYRGWVAEEGPAALLGDPTHPYTAGLVRAIPTLGDVKDLRPLPAARSGAPVSGCPFADRCTQATEACGFERPHLAPATHGEASNAVGAVDGNTTDGSTTDGGTNDGGTNDGTADGAHRVACVHGGVRTVLSARGLTRSYTRSAGAGRRRAIPALREVDVDVRHGEVVGLVGASGAGKSTLASLLAGLDAADDGEVWLDGEPFSQLRGRERRRVHARVQLVQQDAVEAFSPRRTLGESVAEPLEAQGIGTPESRVNAAASALVEARLDPALASRYPAQVSGGQLQRAALARALILEPDVLIADESLSMLDPSEQAGMLDALKALQVRRGMAIVVTSHDLAVVLRLADRVVVLDGGRVVEEATGAELLRAPTQPVTRELLAASGHATPSPIAGDGALGRVDVTSLFGQAQATPAGQAQATPAGQAQATPAGQAQATHAGSGAPDAPTPVGALDVHTLTRVGDPTDLERQEPPR